MKLTDYEKKGLKQIRSGLSECMVLLKSDGRFPLAHPCRLAAYGNGLRHTIKGGTGSGEVNSHFFVTAEQGLQLAGFELTTAAWLDGYDALIPSFKKRWQKTLKEEAKAKGVSVSGYSFGITMPEQDYDLPLDPTGDAAIYVLSRNSGENADRRPVEGDLFLTKTEIHDILELNDCFDTFMLVLNTGGVVDLSPVAEVKNIMILSQLGVETGKALADVLLGAAYPSGKLTTTWAAWEDYCPAIDFGRSDESDYHEGIFVGYRYFDSVNKKALFPFGFGLSYTTFMLGKPSVRIQNSSVTVTVDVTNTGTRPGKEVVQVYLSSPQGKLPKAYQELAAFAKTDELTPGQVQNISLSFSLEDFSCFDQETMSYLLEAGDYIVRVGNASTNTIPAAVMSLGKECIVRKVKSITKKIDIKEENYTRTSLPTSTEPEMKGASHHVLDLSMIRTEVISYNRKPEIAPAVKRLSDRELALFSVGNFMDHGISPSVIGTQSGLVAGGAGDSNRRLEDRGFPSISMADGPAGLRLARRYFEEGKNKRAVTRSILPDAMLDGLSKPAYWFCTTVIAGSKPPKNAQLKYQYCIALPIGTAIAQSWNTEFAQTCGDVVGAEMERFGVNLWLAPGMNLHRSILCGRNFEYYSEDPIVTAKFAAAITRGVQAHPGCGTTIKHYAANSQETARGDVSARMSERTLREMYLKAFALCIRESQPHALMSSYNLVNDVHTSESRGLIEDYLRSENKFEGIVMTDWVIPLMAFASKYHRGAKAGYVAAAGGDIFMPGSRSDYRHVLKMLISGELTREQLEINATRLYHMCEQLRR